MSEAKTCYSCEHFLGIYDVEGTLGLLGFCDRVDDCNYLFTVLQDRDSCLFGEPGRTLSSEEIRNRDSSRIRKQPSFEEHLEYCARLVDGWPKWMKTCLGGRV